MIEDTENKGAKMSWQDPSRYLKHIYLEESCQDDDYAQEIIERAGLPVSIVPEKELTGLVEGDFPHNLGSGKKVLVLCRNRGEFLKRCPATRQYRCCDYQVLNVGTGCPMDCVYCILQAYLNTPYQTFFTNTPDLLGGLREKLSEAEGFQRVGTGEFTDSLALDRITRLSRLLVPAFAKTDNAILELKTKSGYVENLAGLPHNGRTMLSWSLNSAEIIKNEEIRSATLKQRLLAAKRCSSWGYHLGFHFDPIISYPGWEQGYRSAVQELFGAVPAETIRWISLGGFRYLPSLKKIGSSRFRHSHIYDNEFIEGLDGKQRYFRPHRVELYKMIYRAIRKYSHPTTCIYFCMESDEVWREVMGYCPADQGGLPAMLDRSVSL
jgi:spore photoproduct lyase